VGGELAVGASQTVTVEATCKAPGTTSATIAVSAASAGSGTASVEITCFGSKFGPTSAALDLTALVGQSDSKSFVVNNIGNRDLAYDTPLTLTSGSIALVSSTSG
jgi:hypothetical protein